MMSVNDGTNIALSVKIRGVTALAQHSQKAIHMENETLSRESRQLLNKSEISLSEAEAASDYELRDSSKKSRKLKKPKVLRPVGDGFSTALHYNSYCLVEMSSRYDDQVVKQIAKYVLRFLA